MGSGSRNMVGPQVRLLRKRKNLSQKDVAARCTLSGFRVEWDTISKIERQVRGVSDLEMALLAKALRVCVSQLVPDKLPQWKKNTALPHVTDDD